MSTHAKWIGVAIVLLGLVAGTQYVRGSVPHTGLNNAATAISPEQLTEQAGPLPETVIESFI